jgi:hypothetical protein
LFHWSIHQLHCFLCYVDCLAQSCFLHCPRLMNWNNPHCCSLNRFCYRHLFSQFARNGFLFCLVTSAVSRCICCSSSTTWEAAVLVATFTVRSISTIATVSGSTIDASDGGTYGDRSRARGSDYAHSSLPNYRFSLEIYSLNVQSIQYLLRYSHFGSTCANTLWSSQHSGCRKVLLGVVACFEGVSLVIANFSLNHKLRIMVSI